MKLARAKLSDLDEEDQLLFLVLASTGMRLSEAFEIEQEFEERGCRFTIVGTKSATSKRRVPFPRVLIPYLPKRVSRPLFTGSIPAASKRLNRFLDHSGIDDPDKVVHSLRHRAQDRLRAAGCPRTIDGRCLDMKRRRSLRDMERDSPCRCCAGGLIA